ncbi:unnamed protein product [Sphenostylis stenocarpa]|uniref:S-acyltransferase n=1 Tax=Sphenostylis stenocarpa TaxID=92480 RepID=A0AA86RZ68_9FABA|nr:unnamed protein product [Sphenostylis stenocarpa]
MDSSSSTQEQYVTEVTENFETTCWGCGLRVLLPSCASAFKCGWCGAITDQNKKTKSDQKCIKWRVVRDRCFVSVVLVFIFFVIFGGVWAVYPVVFAVSILCGVLHSVVTAILSIATISFFSFAAFRCAGAPPNTLWGSYPAVGKGDLENYTYCHYCSKPKSPRAHHCRSCRKCILDMDHHCPFIGNCVGAANHRSFIGFLISAVLSTIYVSIMSVYAGLRVMPPLKYSVGRINGIGLSVLLWQQLSYIYEGKTYLSHLSSQTDNEEEKKDCQNLARFFGFQYSVTRFLPNFGVTQKRHIK